MTDGNIPSPGGADLVYFQRRAEQEVKRAQAASNPAVVAAHYGLAEIYLDKVSLLRDAPERGTRAPVEPDAQAEDIA
ncbi:MAG: hypothetical protein KF780_12750 [Sphingomonas sp.]|nr:hypothetical protein [Sphingomonas sp.]